MTDRRDFLKLASLSMLPLMDGMAAEAKQPKKYSGKVMVITGATSGIGEATARAFADQGADVYFCGRRKNLGEQVESSIKKKGGQAHYIQTDVRDEKQVDAFFSQIFKKTKKIDFAFLNAGIAPLPTPLHKTSTHDMQDIMNTNFYGVVYSMRKVLPSMMEQKSGVILISSSMGVRRVINWESIYSGSKMALNALIQHGAQEYRKYNIRCVGLEPVGVRTPMLERHAQFLKLPIEKLGNPATGRLIEPSEIADLVLNLCEGDNCRLINGMSLDLSEGGSNELIFFTKKSPSKTTS